MNAQSPVRATSVDWECVCDNFYIATPEDFPEGCGVILNADTGAQWGVGKNKLGATVKLKLYVPLCGGCDEPLDMGVCHGCQLVHTDVQGVAA